MRLMSPAPRPTLIARTWVRNRIHPGDTAIDATTGNGHDTQALAAAVGPAGRVIGLDVQEPAIAATRARLEAHGLAPQATLHCTSHIHIASHARPSSVAAVMFNLGYLPGGDHALTTREEDTIAALDAACPLLRPGGILSVVCYPGHEEGSGESAAVTRWFAALDPLKWRTIGYRLAGTRHDAPFLLAAIAKDTSTRASGTLPSGLASRPDVGYSPARHG